MPAEAPASAGYKSWRICTRDSFVIEGGARLRGNLRIAGSKNAALPVMAAALLADAKSVIADIPNLQDIRSQIELLKLLGCRVDR